MLELAGAGHVRATAQVREGALGVQGHILASRNTADDFSLVVLAQTLEILHRLIARHDRANDWLVLGGQLGHAFLDRSQIVRGKGPAVGEVVIKTMLDDRADGDLRLGEQFFHRVGQQVGRGVTNHVQAVGILGGDDGQARIAGDGVRGIHQLAFHASAQGGFGQTGANRGGDLGDRHRARELSLGSIGKRDVEHGHCSGKKKHGVNRAGGEGTGRRELQAVSGQGRYPHEFAVS